MHARRPSRAKATNACANPAAAIPARFSARDSAPAMHPTDMILDEIREPAGR